MRVNCWMPAVLAALVLPSLLLAGALQGCSRGQPYDATLSPAEERAVARLGRDRWLDVLSVHRNASGDLIALTQQGNEQVQYRIHLDDQGEATFERAPVTTFGSQ